MLRFIEMRLLCSQILRDFLTLDSTESKLDVSERESEPTTPPLLKTGSSTPGWVSSSSSEILGLGVSYGKIAVRIPGLHVRVRQHRLRSSNTGISAFDTYAVHVFELVCN